MRYVRYVLLAAIVCALILCLTIVASLPNDRGEAAGRIHIAFGFHVNTSHSFRVDEADETGFGRDIRIIRSIISTLDEANVQGTKVSGTWDIENLFALGDTFPRHAPDIITSLQRRVAMAGDRVLPMSYGNALMGAVNNEEFDAEIEKAITNEAGSGIRDLFGDGYRPIVRPQEMMITPGSFNRYKSHGIEALALYHSAIPFDAFRAFVEPLSRQDALNPLLYQNSDTGECMTIIPTYNHGDLLEMGSLRLWVADLRERQIRGEIPADLLIFLNLDADDPFWFGIDLPWWCSWLPNAKGLQGLIDSVRHLPYVVFTTPDRYLADHPAGKTISFGQDTADGANTGYQSWGEKLTSHLFWTAVEEDRRRHKAVRSVYAAQGISPPSAVREALSASFDQRLRLLSTTNYGIATPFLATGREEKAKEIMGAMLAFSEQAWRLTAPSAPALEQEFPVPPSGWRIVDTLTCYGFSDRPRFIHLPVIDASEFSLMGRDGRRTPLTIVSHRADRLVAMFDDTMSMNEGEPFALLAKDTADSGRVRDGGTSWQDSASLLTQGMEGIGAPGSFLPQIVYGGGQNNRVTVSGVQETSIFTTTGGIWRWELGGGIPGPTPDATPGAFNLTMTRLEAPPYLFLQGRYLFPATNPKDISYGMAPALNLTYDSKWLEVVPTPMALSFFGDEAPMVYKQNFLGIDSAFALDFIRSASSGAAVEDVNNHVAGAYVAVATSKIGIAVSADTTVTAGFAPFPMKVAERAGVGWDVLLNPFGAFIAAPYSQPTWGKGTGSWVAWRSALHYASGAPSYNGGSLGFSLAIATYPGGEHPARVKNDLASFAHPPVTVSNKFGLVGRPGAEVRNRPPAAAAEEGQRPLPRLPAPVLASLLIDGVRHYLMR